MAEQIKVFYAWQSDRDGKINRFLIRDAANEAIKRLNADVKITSAPRIELDQDHQWIHIMALQSGTK